MSKLLMVFIPILLISGCNNNKTNPLNMDQLYAWCIVPFDSEKRTPEQRIEMLRELGFKAYAYDWREEHLPDMAREINLAEKHDIKIIAVWMGIDKKDAAGNMSENNQKILQTLAETQLKTQIWVSFPENYFEGMDEEQKFEQAAEMISYISLEAEDIGCRVGLYNHGGWFGRPENMVSIIESMPRLNLGIIFNFHHAHDMINEFQGLVNVMKPYLWAVNLNGMNPEGPKILPLGKGQKEAEMIESLKKIGYNGPYGILGHVDNADVKKVLEANLKGLKTLPELDK